MGEATTTGRRSLPWKMLVVGALVAVLLSAGLALWLSVRSMTSARCPAIVVDVRNAGAIRMARLDICVGTRCKAILDLDPGQSRDVHLVPISESSVVVGRRGQRAEDLDVYVEPGWSGRLAVDIDASGAAIRSNELVGPQAWQGSLCSAK